MASSNQSTLAGPRDFRTTHWSLVVAATKPDSTQTRAALAALCEIYWFPVYAYIRRRGFGPESAKDLTQGLFAKIIEKQYLRAADREKGRFRTFLLVCVQHFLNNEWQKEHALKRGGGYSIVSLDEQLAEDCYRAEPMDTLSPERLFERRWAIVVLEQAMEHLRVEFLNAGKAAQFEKLQVFLSGSKEAPASYAEVGTELGLTENAARQTAFRMRSRYGELLRHRVSQCVASPAETEAELRHLFTVLSY